MELNEAASQMGRKGGKSKSPAKQEAARENGKLGGRPKNPYAPEPRKTYPGLSGNSRDRRKQRRAKKEKQ